LATARLTTFQVTSPGDDLRRLRLSSKASLGRRPVHTRRLRRKAGRQLPMATLSRLEDSLEALAAAGRQVKGRYDGTALGR
jgi:hypothetical protein